MSATAKKRLRNNPRQKTTRRFVFTCFGRRTRRKSECFSRQDVDLIWNMCTNALQSFHLDDNLYTCESIGLILDEIKSARDYLYSI